ncbi:hypothetical protein TeGR_g7395 [Tetraparma gracilis]|jgi:hypothetical protein|uniref:Uncharacterized protein n=1 Tax=Tetraparma gracilis TaxID=2962635 RepID=A0ABQ6M7J3_9STRA|nr:hypothetical protein TeGR_g7395 [Tetraparma gracilis]
MSSLSASLPNALGTATLSLTGVPLTSTLPPPTLKAIHAMLRECGDVLAGGEALRRMTVDVDGAVYTVAVGGETIYVAMHSR